MTDKPTPFKNKDREPVPSTSQTFIQLAPKSGEKQVDARQGSIHGARKCHICQRTGHIAKHCPNKGPSGFRRKQSAPNHLKQGLVEMADQAKGSLDALRERETTIKEECSTPKLSKEEIEEAKRQAQEQKEQARLLQVNKKFIDVYKILTNYGGFDPDAKEYEKPKSTIWLKETAKIKDTSLFLVCGALFCIIFLFCFASVYKKGIIIKWTYSTFSTVLKFMFSSYIKKLIATVVVVFFKLFERYDRYAHHYYPNLRMFVMTIFAVICYLNLDWYFYLLCAVQASHNFKWFRQFLNTVAKVPSVIRHWLCKLLPFTIRDDYWLHEVTVLHTEFSNDLSVDMRTTEVAHIQLKTPEWKVRYQIRTSKVSKIRTDTNGWTNQQTLSKFEGEKSKPVVYTCSLGLFLESSSHDIFGIGPDPELFRMRLEQKFRSKVDVNFSKSTAIMERVTHGTYELVRVFWCDAVRRWSRQDFH